MDFDYVLKLIQKKKKKQLIQKYRTRWTNVSQVSQW